ncbi:TetR/AcrR family transcriptional regulator [Gluconobacter kanchanaburiensis]|uniref:TetR family transcriptional regulator n=1 Tax=Gluconobacter kanchanaburiensis NBRC 103587 TaxID=1307948 RepID=A0A511B6I3_9PROT|nr:TetR/AcrR family transcriptional regulator [Gluconobacter kanchanaburiensis]MBF0861606.1 TetR/AcrR family transcriptional regulator [Gluconobacter kanchanaburiensis]GBR67075.1 TetR family transcriptional regulator [Gluconobacter kanchanaburiensis NBRC 103587]GEK95251.1 TetR family transcriptional regulator [Gluconobacter kanchanaburiensis NBRC 103587]
MSQTVVTQTLPLKNFRVLGRERLAPRAPGRPVNLKLKDNILAAIAQVLVEEGYQGLTISRVARSAGVSTATVYRRWPTKQAMFFDAIRLWRDDLTPQIDTGSFAGDVDALIAARVRFLATPLGRTYGTLLGEAVHDQEFGQVLWETSVAPARAQMALFFERATRRGERVFCQDPDTVLDMLLSTIHFRAMNMLGREPMNPEKNVQEIQSLAHCLISC